VSGLSRLAASSRHAMSVSRRIRRNGCTQSALMRKSKPCWTRVHYCAEKSSLPRSAGIIRISSEEFARTRASQPR